MGELMQCPACLQNYTSTETHNCQYLREDNYGKEFLLMYKCQRCKKTFSGLSNVGMHKCKYHPGIIDGNDRWTCCGARRVGVTNPYVHNMIWKRANQSYPLLVDLSGGGCTPCDHYHPDNPVKMPVKLSNPSVITLLGELDPPFDERPGYNTELQQLEEFGKKP